MFCTGCGAKVSQGQSERPDAGFDSARLGSDIPLIALAPQEKFYSKRSLKRMGSVAGALLAIIIVALGAVAITAWVANNPGASNQFAEDDVRSDKYKQCLSLVQDVRNDNLEDIIDDVINAEGTAQDYYFLQEYEQSFNSIVGEDCTEMERTFADCCFMVSYTEFCAKKFKHFSTSGLFGSSLSDDADMFRGYADELWEKLLNAESMSQLQEIISYCESRDIIYLKR